MGKFDGVLFATDYDDTLYNSRMEVSGTDHAAIRYFMEQGGRFTVATGRAYSTFTPQIALERLELNAPVVLANGASIYDYAAGRFLVQTELPAASPERICALCDEFPALAVEVYHGEDVYVHNPNFVTWAHIERVKSPYTLMAPEEIPRPWAKLLLEQEPDYLQEVRRSFLARWEADYEAIFSNPYLLEVTAKGSDKGSMVAEVARRLGIAPDHVYCIGDNQNDIPMLAVSAIPFAPANCAPVVKEWGARILCHCDEGAVAHAIRVLDEIY